MDLVTETMVIPKTGETVIGKHFSMIPGGKGANQAVATARLGAEVRMIGCVGDDPFGKELISHLKKQGVIIDNIEVITGLTTGTATITVSKGDNSIIVIPGANIALTPEKIELLEDVIAKSDIVLLQLEIPLETVMKAAEIAKKYKIPVILNPAPIKPLPDQLIHLIDYITPNEHELMYFFDSSVEDLHSFMKRRGSQFIVTKGEDGVYFYQDGELIHIPGYSVDVVDTTGAGDSFNGALAVGLSKGLDLKEACKYGNAVGALSVTKFGAQNGMPTQIEVEQFLRTRGEEKI